MKEILDSRVIYQEGTIHRVATWYRGYSHWEGRNIPPQEGLSGGPEHVIERTVLIPSRIIEVHGTSTSFSSAAR